MGHGVVTSSRTHIYPVTKIALSFSFLNDGIRGYSMAAEIGKLVWFDEVELPINTPNRLTPEKTSLLKRI